MSKLGTVHVEIKPVLDEQAIREIEDRLGVSVENLSGFQLMAITLGDIRERLAALEAERK